MFFDSQTSKQKLDFVNKCKKLLAPIIKTLTLCDREGLILRDTNDTGRITSEKSETNCRNFHAFLRH